MGVTRVMLRPVVTCGRCFRQEIVDGDDARMGAVAARQAGWVKEERYWLCPFCHAQASGVAAPPAIKERVVAEMCALSDGELALLHGAVVAEIRRRSRP